MTHDDLARIEERLGLSLPESYRATMLRYPFEGKSYATDCELPNDPELLIQSNEYLRQHGFFGEPWPHHYFSFGGDGAGNEYFFDLSEQRAGTTGHPSICGLQAPAMPQTSPSLSPLHAAVATLRAACAEPPRGGKPDRWGCAATSSPVRHAVVRHRCATVWSDGWFAARPCLRCQPAAHALAPNPRAGAARRLRLQGF